MKASTINSKLIYYTVKYMVSQRILIITLCYKKINESMNYKKRHLWLKTWEIVKENITKMDKILKKHS